MFLPSNITLQFGDSGDFVSELQRRLAMVDCHPEDQVNGFYDGVTVNSVTRFQSMNGIRADGVAGPETLRLLNGTVSGSSGSSDTKEEEEAKAAQHSAMVDNFALAQAQHADPSLLSPATETMGEEAPSLIAEPQAYRPEPAPESIQPQPVSVTEQMIREDAVRDQAQQRQLTTHELLMAQLQRTAEQFTPPPPEQEMQSHAHAREPMPTPQPKPALPDPQEASLPGETQPQPQAGVVGKTIRFTNAMLQKIADYLEAKLPPSVLRDVQETGQLMANRGVRETAIPSGPDLAAPEQLPARGPEQQSQTTRA